MNRIIIIVLPLFLVCCLIATGCKKDPNAKYPVSGLVIHNGVPLKTGAISFNPVDSKTVDTSSASTIIDGKYSIAKKDGLKPGEYKVMVFGQLKIEGKTRDLGPGYGKKTVTMEVIPKRYNHETTLKETVEAKKNKFDFTFDIDPSEFVEHMF